MSEIKSLPCPFCGSVDISDGEVTTQQLVNDVVKTSVQSECQSCGALGPTTPLANGEADYGDVRAIAGWNRRHVDASHNLMLTVLRDIAASVGTSASASAARGVLRALGLQ